MEPLIVKRALHTALNAGFMKSTFHPSAEETGHTCTLKARFATPGLLTSFLPFALLKLHCGAKHVQL